MNVMNTTSALTTGTRVRIVKGCAARGVIKGTSATITVTPLGKEYGYSVKVALYFLNGKWAGKTLVFNARHPNRLSDSVVRMNDGNPFHTIEVEQLTRKA